MSMHEVVINLNFQIVDFFAVLPLVMGTLLKTVSKLFVSGSNDKRPKHHINCSSSSDEQFVRRLSSQQDSMPALGSEDKSGLSGQGNDKDAGSPVKRRSSDPYVESFKRTCDDGYDSGVEPDRSSDDNTSPKVDSRSTINPKIGSRKSATDKAAAQDGNRNVRRSRDVQLSAARQVDFEQDVVVHSAFIDDDGNRQSFCERSRLKTASMRERERGNCARSSSLTDFDDRQSRVAKPEPPTCRTASIDILPDPDVRFRIAREPRTGARLLRFCIRLGPAFSGGATVMVKANSSGNKINLLAHRASAAADPSSSSSSKKSSSKCNSRDVYRDAFPLPVVIDSNLLTAIVDTDGRVLVEAPVLAPADPLLERWLDRHPPTDSSSTKDRKITRRGVINE